MSHPSTGFNNVTYQPNMLRIFYFQHIILTFVFSLAMLILHRLMYVEEGHYYLPTPIRELMAAVVVPLVLYLLFQTAEWVAWMGPDNTFSRKISTILNHANMACGFMLAWPTGICGIIRGPSESYGAYIVFLGYDASLIAIYLWIWDNVFYIDKKPTITSWEIQTAVRLLLLGNWLSMLFRKEPRRWPSSLAPQL